MQLQMKFTKVLFHGRSPMVTDVMIDTMGVLLGILVVILGMKIWNNIRAKKTT